MKLNDPKLKQLLDAGLRIRARCGNITLGIETVEMLEALIDSFGDMAKKDWQIYIDK